MDTQEEYAKQTRSFLEQKLRLIESEDDLLESLKTLTKRSDKTIEGHNTDLKDCVIKVFKGTVVSGSALEKFLETRPVMPHENSENYLAATAKILVNLLQDSYGKSIPGGMEDFSFGSNEAKKLWESIQNDFTKILQEHFGVTPFFDDSRSSSWASIGFSVDAKWSQK